MAVGSVWTAGTTPDVAAEVASADDVEEGVGCAVSARDPLQAHAQTAATKEIAERPAADITARR